MVRGLNISGRGPTVQGRGLDIGPVGPSATEVDYFDDGDISEYGGDTGQFNTQTGTVRDGSHALEGVNSGSTSSIGSNPGDGLNYYPDPGDTIEWFAYHNRGGKQIFVFDANGGFGAMAGGPAIQFIDGNTLQFADGNDDYGSQSLSENLSNSWAKIELVWGENGDVTATAYNPSGDAVGSLQRTGWTTRTGSGIAYVVRNVGSDVFYDTVRVV